MKPGDKVRVTFEGIYSGNAVGSHAFRNRGDHEGTRRAVLDLDDMDHQIEILEEYKPPRKEEDFPYGTMIYSGGKLMYARLAVGWTYMGVGEETDAERYRPWAVVDRWMDNGACTVVRPGEGTTVT